MKNILILLLASFLALEISAQNRDATSDFGKSGSASIHLIDSELIVSKDKSNSILKFEIYNKNPYPIYIPQPEQLMGTVPQYFDLNSTSVECEQEFFLMRVRSSAEFILIPAGGSKEFELHSEFFQNSCLGNEKLSSAILVYRAMVSREEDEFIANELLIKNRDSRDIIEYIFTTPLKSGPIKIIYE